MKKCLLPIKLNSQLDQDELTLMRKSYFLPTYIKENLEHIQTIIKNQFPLIEIEAYSHRSWEFFLRLSEPQQLAAYEKINKILLLCIKNKKHSISSKADFFKCLLKNQFQLDVNPYFFDEIQDEDTINIHTKNSSLFFYDFLSMTPNNYTLLDLIIYDPSELYQGYSSTLRSISQELFQQGNIENPRALYDHFKSTTYLLKESFSETQSLVKLTVKLIAPLFNQNNLFGFISSSSLSHPKQDNKNSSQPAEGSNIIFLS